MTAKDLQGSGIVYQLGVVPRRIDIMTKASGVSSEEAWSTRVVREVDGRAIGFLGSDALIKNKRATARPKDLADVAALEQLMGRPK